jgi:hypothetical protein
MNDSGLLLDPLLSICAPACLACVSFHMPASSWIDETYYYHHTVA